MLNHSIFVSMKTRRIKCSRVQQEASVFFQKTVQNAYSLFHICNPTPNHIFSSLSKNALIYDFTSANVIVRSMFEAYINMYFLLLDKISDEERNFRLDRWEKHALTERKIIVEALGSKHSILETDAEEINKFETKIYESKYFNKLSENEQTSIRKSKKWTKLNALEKADLAGIDRSQAEYLYKILSNYTHSESYAIMQLHSIEEPLEAKELCNLSMIFGEMFLSLSLAGFASVNQDVLELAYQNEQVVELIKFWNQLKSKKLNELSQQRI